MIFLNFDNAAAAVPRNRDPSQMVCLIRSFIRVTLPMLAKGGLREIITQPLAFSVSAKSVFDSRTTLGNSG